MDVPTLVSDALGDEGVAARVPLKGDDALYVTKTRTIRYSDEGLLSDESVEEYPHDAERVTVDQGRRKATITLDYGTDGTKSFSVPVGSVDSALHPVIAGVLNANGVTGPGETVKRTFRFSELTLVVTSDRLVKHVGSAVWDDEFEEIAFEEVTGVSVEEGNVSSQYVLQTPGRTQRIKAPNESFREVRETIEEAILSFHGVDTVAEFEALVAEDEGEEPIDDPADVSFESGVDPIGAGSTDGQSGEAQTAEPGPESATTDGESESAQAAAATDDEAAEELAESGFTSAAAKVESSIDPDELRAELDELEAAIEHQRELLERQQAWVDELRELIPGR